MEYISRKSAVKLNQFVPQSPLRAGQWFYDLDLSETAHPLMYVAPNYVLAGETISSYLPAPSKRVPAYTSSEMLGFLLSISIRKGIDGYEASSLGITKTDKALPEAMAQILIEYYTRILA